MTSILANDSQQLQNKDLMAAWVKLHSINAAVFKIIFFLEWPKAFGCLSYAFSALTLLGNAQNNSSCKSRWRVSLIKDTVSV